MHILVIGGTQFVGRNFVAEALDRGHAVTLLHRGQTNPDLFPEADHLLADRNDNLAALHDRRFDATVDVCAYVPRQVDRLADALEDRGGQHLHVSSISAYAEMSEPGQDESSPLNDAPDPPTETVDWSTYGKLKAACERAAAARYGDALTVVRPSYVIGPHDHTGRFPWWVRRIARGGDVLAPGPQEAPFQAIDARDLAAFMVILLESGTTGAFHAASPPPPYSFGDMLAEVAATVAPEGTQLVWTDAKWLAGQDGDVNLPFWDRGERAWELAVDPGKALASGLHPRPLRDSARDTLAWLKADGSVPRDAGLAPEREAALLHAWRESTN